MSADLHDLADLRATLASHALGVPGGDPVARSASVRRRVRVVRRRRAAGAGAAVVAVVVALLLAVSPGGGRSVEPAGREVAGVTAPATMTTLGLTYELAEVVGGDSPTAEVALDEDEPVLVTWATAADQDTVEITLRSAATEQSAVHVADDLDDWVVVDPDPSGPVRVTASASGDDVGLAVYRVAGPADPAPGAVTSGGITFRSAPGPAVLGADVGEPGSTTAAVDLPAGDTALTVDYRASCVGASGQVRITLVLDGTPMDSGIEHPCEPVVPREVGVTDAVGPDGEVVADAYGASSTGLRDGEPHRLEMQVESVDGGPLDPAARPVLVVRQAVPGAGTSGQAPGYLEVAGHGWRLAGSAVDDRSARVEVPDGVGSALAVSWWSAAESPSGTVQVRRGGEVVTSPAPQARRAASTTYAVSPGDVLSTEVTGGGLGAGSGRTRPPELGVAWYVRAD